MMPVVAANGVDELDTDMSPPSPANDGEKEESKWIGHYSSSHKILLVGEGDFSFSLSLAHAFASATNIVATSLDSQESLGRKYNHAIENVRRLEGMGGLVLHGIDATKMADHFFLRTQRFDRIVYNFPHVGFRYREGSGLQIELNKRLVKGFFGSGRVLLRKEGGEVHVTHKTGECYDKWNLVKKAEKEGLVLKQKVGFCKEDYPGYGNKRADGCQSDAPFHMGDCTTFMFVKKPTQF